MPRYVRVARKAKAEFVRTISLTSGDWDVHERISIEVYPNEPTLTGLLFPDGEPVVRVSDPIGFTTLKEE